MSNTICCGIYNLELWVLPILCHWSPNVGNCELVVDHDIEKLEQERCNVYGDVHRSPSYRNRNKTDSVLHSRAKFRSMPSFGYLDTPNRFKCVLGLFTGAGGA